MEYQGKEKGMGKMITRGIPFKQHKTLRQIGDLIAPWVNLQSISKGGR